MGVGFVFSSDLFEPNKSIQKYVLIIKLIKLLINVTKHREIIKSPLIVWQSLSFTDNCLAKLNTVKLQCAYKPCKYIQSTSRNSEKVVALLKIDYHRL